MITSHENGYKNNNDMIVKKKLHGSYDVHNHHIIMCNYES